MTVTWRGWQAECLPLLTDHLRAPDVPVLCAVATGAGKSLVQAELAARAAAVVGRSEVVVYATSRTALVDQIEGDLRRACVGHRVGRFDVSGKSHRGKRVIATNYKSLGKLIDALTRSRQTVGALILDEAHNSECEQVKRAAECLGSDGLKRIYGFTATAFRARTGETLSLFERLIYRYTYLHALDDGILMPYLLRTRAGGWVEQDDGLVRFLLEAGVVGTGPGMILSPMSCDEADRIADLLCAQGVRAVAVHSGNDGRKALPGLIRDFNRAAVDCVVSPRLVEEGFDYRPLSWAFFWGSCGSRVRAVQVVGRALRRVCPDRDAEALAAWGGLPAVAQILDPHGQIAAMGLDHDPAIGQADEEDAEDLRPVEDPKPRPERDEGARMLGLRLAPVSWAEGFAVWAMQQPDLRPYVPPRSDVGTSAGVTWAQAREAATYLAKMRPVAAELPHWRLLREGLQLIGGWGGGDPGSHGYAAETILRAARTLRAARESGERVAPLGPRLPDALLPVTVDGIEG